MSVAAVAPEPMTTTCLPVVVEIGRPRLRVDDAALEGVHVLPLRRVAGLVAVVALAHPQEVRGEAQRFARIGAGRVNRPEVVRARPTGGRDLVAIADVTGEIVLGDDVAHVGADLGRGRDRRAGPRLEAIAEGVQVAVRTDARIFVRPPGAAEVFLSLQHDETRARPLLGQVIGAAHAGDAGADDQDVEMLGLSRDGMAVGGFGGWRVHGGIPESRNFEFSQLPA